MPRYQNWRARRPAAHAGPVAKALDTNEYRSPAVGLEDKIFTISTTANAAQFEVVKEELGKHFATKPWSCWAGAAIVFETLTEPSYNDPKEPDFPIKMISNGDKKTEDPEYEAKLMQ